MQGYGLVAVPPLPHAIAPRSALAWLAAALLLMSSGVLVLAGPRAWWMAALPGVLFSQAVVVVAWSDAKFGTLANVIVLVPLAIVIGGRSVTEADLASYPPLLQRCLTRAGAVGKSRVRKEVAAVIWTVKRAWLGRLRGGQAAAECGSRRVAKYA